MESLKEFTFKAGEMIIVDQKVKANPDQGLLRFYMNSDSLLCLEWTNLTKNIKKDPIAILPGDWIWKKISTAKGRVFMLQNTWYPDEKYLYWMQYPKEKEEEYNILITSLVNTGELCPQSPIPKQESNAEDKMCIDDIETESNPQPKADANANSNYDFIKSFAESMKQFQKAYPDWGKILSRDNMNKLLNNLEKTEIEEWIKLLPENQKNMQGLHESLASPQFQQSCGQLSAALKSENLPAIIQSFGLDLNEANKYANGVEAFIKCIVAKYSKKDK